jgi:hypothetical protein
LKRYVPVKQWSVTLKYLYIFFLFISFQSYATTWGESEVEDPIESDLKCMVQEPASSGSYIYQWPSKYDQVFWPLTSSQGIWHCKGSGFIAFIGDFEKITEDEKIKISQYLKKSDKNNIDSLISKLELLEALYSLRNKGDEFNNRIKRVFAYLYEQEGQLELANTYRKAALEEINVFLKTDLSEYKKLEYLYVAANYERQLGSITNSDSRLLMLKVAIKDIKDENLKGFGSYLLELTKDTLRIIPNGILAPNEVESGT